MRSISISRAEPGRRRTSNRGSDAIAINPNYVQYVHATLVAALALTEHDAEAREALQRYLALPSTGPLKTIAAWKAYYSAQGGDPPRVEMNERVYDGLRKAGLPEK
jgi:hypothetical protein